jgi:hypothetical protein
MSDPDRLAVRAVTAVLPFQANEYVTESQVDWRSAPDDPFAGWHFAAGRAARRGHDATGRP